MSRTVASTPDLALTVKVRVQDAVVALSAADCVRLASAGATFSLFALFADSPFAALEGFDKQLVRENARVRDVPDF